MSEWKPIESAPRDGTWVLGWWAASAIMEAVYFGEEGYCITSTDVDETGNPTHWMPLPEPPQPVEGE